MPTKKSAKNQQRGSVLAKRIRGNNKKKKLLSKHNSPSVNISAGVYLLNNT